MTLNLGKLVRVQWEMAELSRELIGREGIGECSHDHILYCLNPEVGSGLQVHKPYVLPGNWNCLKLTTQRSCHWIPGPVFLLSWLLCRRGRGVTGSELRRFISPSSSCGRRWNSIDLWGDRVIPLQGKCFFLSSWLISLRWDLTLFTFQHTSVSPWDKTEPQRPGSLGSSCLDI